VDRARVNSLLQEEKLQPLKAAEPTLALKKGVRMDQNRFAKRVTVVAGLFFLCAAPGLTRAQSSRPGPVQTPNVASPAVRLKRDARPTDDFAGLKFTHDQKAKIDEIHRTTESQLAAVVKDEKLSEDQKEAMLDGFRRMERGQVFKLLTPEQQKEVRERVRARRAAEQEEKKKRQSLRE